MYLSPDQVSELHLQLNVSQQCATGNGGALIPQVAAGPSGQFKRVELGLGWGEDPSILTTMATVQVDNRHRREQLLRTENQLVHALRAEANKRRLRTFAKAAEPPRGCTGCPSCVPETRARPRRSSDATSTRTLAAGDHSKRRGGARADMKRRRQQHQLVQSVVRRNVEL